MAKTNKKDNVLVCHTLDGTTFHTAQLEIGPEPQRFVIVGKPKAGNHITPAQAAQIRRMAKTVTTQAGTRKLHVGDADKASAERAKLQAEADRLRGELNAVQKELADSHARIAELEGALADSHQARIAELEGAPARKGS